VAPKVDKEEGSHRPTKKKKRETNKSDGGAGDGENL